MNLGQLIGELTYGKLEPRPRPELAEAAERARREEESQRCAAAERVAAAEAERRRQERELDHGRAEKLREQLKAERAVADAARSAKSAAKVASQSAREQGALKRRGGRSQQMRELLAKHPRGLTSAQIAAHFNINTALASAHLSGMPGIEKTGNRRRYIYRLKVVPPQEK